jgi:hypothetical protein
LYSVKEFEAGKEIIRKKINEAFIIVEIVSTDCFLLKLQKELMTGLLPVKLNLTNGTRSKKDINE